MNKKKIKILFIGINNFSIPFFYKIINYINFKIKFIISKNDDNLNLIKNICKKKKIKILIINNFIELKKIKNKIVNKFIDIGIIISYGLKIPQNIINIPKYGFINIHASLLPRWRGPAPIQWTLLSNDKITGISIIKINKNIDEGKIIYQRKIYIKKKYNFIILFKKIQNIGLNIINKIIKNIYNNNVKYINQNKKKATYSKKIKKKNGLIKWKINTAKEIESKIKAFYKWPKTFFIYNNNIIFIWKIKILNKNKKYKNIPGKILIYNKKKLIICSKDLPISILILQLNNKKKNKISELFNYNPTLFNNNIILN